MNMKDRRKRGRARIFLAGLQDCKLHGKPEDGICNMWKEWQIYKEPKERHQRATCARLKRMRIRYRWGGTERVANTNTNSNTNTNTNAETRKHRSKFHESQQGKTRHSWVADTGCAPARSAMLQIASREPRTKRRNIFNCETSLFNSLSGKSRNRN